MGSKVILRTNFCVLPLATDDWGLLREACAASATFEMLMGLFLLQKKN